MLVEVKRSKSFFITFGIIALLGIIASILIIIFVEDRQVALSSLIVLAFLILVGLLYFIIGLIVYIKNPYLFLIKFADDYIEFSKNRKVYYKDISYVLTDEKDYIEYFVITSHNKIRFYHKSKEMNKTLIDLLKSKDVKVIDSQYKNIANKCVARIYWIVQQDGGRKNIPLSNIYTPQIYLEEEKVKNGVEFSAFVINKKIENNRSTIADIMIFSESCSYEFKEGQQLKIYENNRLVATGEVIKELANNNCVM